ncbi:myb-like protein X [Anneissia japonica]|uniref:myb-like protein X n=1 Tax=Anneissia japonica TaxID=1529436 RepID=UPI0014258F21|nr:myb-like protein X [Anneissia japonica]
MEELEVATLPAERAPQQREQQYAESVLDSEALGDLPLVTEPEETTGTGRRVGDREGPPSNLPYDFNSQDYREMEETIERETANDVDDAYDDDGAATPTGDVPPYVDEESSLLTPNVRWVDANWKQYTSGFLRENENDDLERDPSQDGRRVPDEPETHARPTSSSTPANPKSVPLEDLDAHLRESAKENERTLELGNQKLNEVQDKLAEKERKLTEARVVIQKLKDEIHEAKMSALKESSDVRSIAEEEVERLKTKLASKTDAMKERDLDVVRLESDLKAARRKSKQPPQEESGSELQQKLQAAVRKLKDRDRSHADMEEELEEKDDKISVLKKESTLAKTAMSMYEKRVDVLEENLKTACKRYDEEVKSRRIVEAAAKKASTSNPWPTRTSNCSENC